MSGLRIRLAGIFLLVLFCWTSSIQAESRPAGPVGMVMDLRGEAKASGRRLELGSWVSAGDTVETGRGAQVAVTFFFDRCRRVEMGERSALAVGPQEVRVLRGTLLSDREIQRCYRPQRLSAAGGIGGDQFGMMMLREGERRLTGPYLWMMPSNTHLREQRPTFRWGGWPSASSYRVAVSDTSGKRLWETTTADTTLQYPHVAPELKRGQLYEWEVQGDGGAAVQRARFGIVGQEALTYVQEAETVCATRLKQAPKDAAAHVELALAYEGVGMREEAMIQYRKALVSAPNNAALHAAIVALYDEMLLYGEAARERAALERLEKGVRR